jgi:hypothetical protein
LLQFSLSLCSAVLVAPEFVFKQKGYFLHCGLLCYDM